VIWSPEARADLRGIDRETALQILHCVDRYLTSRNGDVKRLKEPRTGFRLRSGDYRAFFQLKDENTIEITGVRNRREAYRDEGVTIASARRVVRIGRLLQNHGGRLVDFHAAFAGGKHFPGVEPALRIKQRLELLDCIESVFREEMCHQLHFFHSDAVLAGDRATHGNAIVENLVAAKPGAPQFAFLTRIEQNDGMKVSVAGVKDVADNESVLV
jgi:mRNA-degrading endonuclease RelE of RelBE toxin-antitoxin system